jgi:hypothetical protein
MREIAWLLNDDGFPFGPLPHGRGSADGAALLMARY